MIKGSHVKLVFINDPDERIGGLTETWNSMLYLYEQLKVQPYCHGYLVISGFVRP